MRSNDMEAFRVYLASVYSMYRVELSPAVVELWWRALKPQSLSDVKEAIEAHTADGEVGQYCPKPADVIKFIEAKKQPKIPLCAHCQADLSHRGYTRLRFGDVCNPCYRSYLHGDWTA